MNSEYCMGVEVNKALSMHKEKKAQLIPIIIRPVDWADSELSKLQGLPKDALAISSWPNEDEAWVNVISGLKKHIQQFQPKDTSLPEKKPETIRPSEYILNWLSDTEIVLTHRKVNQVKLDDIYVTPDIELESKDNLVDIKSSSYLHKELGHFIISGEEQQGKTSLLKYLYKKLLKKDYLPIYIDAFSVKKSSIEQVINKALQMQYENMDYTTYSKSSKAVILIDNLDNIGLNLKFKNIFLNDITTLTNNTFITCHSSYNYVYGEIPALNEHQRIEMLSLGNKKREELVKKWISLGVEENIEDYELYSKCDDLKSRLNIVIKKTLSHRNQYMY